MSSKQSKSFNETGASPEKKLKTNPIEENNCSQLQTHPLLIEVILTNLFKYFPLHSHQTLRLVCKTWLSISLTTWRLSNILKLHRSRINFRDNGFLSVSEFPSYWSSTLATNPFTHLYLEGWWFENGYDGFLNFWQHFGPNLTTLTLEVCIFSKAEDLFEIIQKFCPKLETLKLYTLPGGEGPNFSPTISYGVENSPNLRNHQDDKILKDFDFGNLRTHQKLRSLQIHPSDFPGLYPTPLKINWLELFCQFPNLSLIHLETVQQASKIIDEFLNEMEKIKEDFPEKFPKWLELDIFPAFMFDEKLANYQISWLESLGIRQTKLVFMFSGESSGEGNLTGEEKLQKLVEFNQKSLQEFHIGTYKCRGLQISEFPFGFELNKLKKLSFDCDKFCGGNFEFLKLTPNLEILIFYNCESESTTRTELISRTSAKAMKNVKLSKLQRLKLDYVVGNEDISNLSKWMPNLKELEIYLDPVQFQLVWESWNGGFRKLFVRRPGNVEIVRQPGRRLNWSEFAEKLEYLTELEVPSDLFLENFQFLRWTRNLCKLTINNQYPESNRTTNLIRNTEENGMDMVRLKKLTNFVLAYTFDERDLLKLVRWMPNVKVFKVVELNHNLFDIIFEYWSGVQISYVGDVR